MGDKSPKSNAKAQRQKARQKQAATTARQGPGTDLTAKPTGGTPGARTTNRGLSL